MPPNSVPEHRKALKNTPICNQEQRLLHPICTRHLPCYAPLVFACCTLCYSLSPLRPLHLTCLVDEVLPFPMILDKVEQCGYYAECPVRYRYVSTCFLRCVLMHFARKMLWGKWMIRQTKDQSDRTIVNAVEPSRLASQYRQRGKEEPRDSQDSRWHTSGYEGGLDPVLRD
ncbi:hypothetical protein B0T09DRAFT_329047, partial [Sordaria sp. MPI-SDFR-AT-0083]